MNHSYKNGVTVQIANMLNGLLYPTVQLEQTTHSGDDIGAKHYDLLR